MTDKAITGPLMSWFEKEKRIFPWSINRTPYRIWISEIMLQQTVASTVIPYFQRWCLSYPDINVLSRAPLQDILAHWEGLGYYSRCRNIHRASHYLMENCGGKLPAEYVDLLKIPGIGDYTARAILSLAFGKPYPVLDANVRRIFQRQEGRTEWTARDDARTLKTLEDIIPPEHPGGFNEALMQLGQQICVSGAPRCTICPISGGCIGFKQGTASSIPEKRLKKIKTSRKKILMIHYGGEILMQRKKNGLFHDLWLLPEASLIEGFTAADGQPHDDTIEFQELTPRYHYYTDHKQTLLPRLLTTKQTGMRPAAPADNEQYEYRWVTVSDLKKYACPSVYRKILVEGLSLITNLSL